MSATLKENAGHVIKYSGTWINIRIKTISSW
jgi:hypothetical protein